ncbi:MAG: aldehyde dehydrogenase family protein [Rhodobacteraceae bacterium]|nr:aldehyde dehydrogenase family protein [Paracoccaceae bacterium]
MGIKEYFDSMDYAPAPESPAEALAWLDTHDRRFGPVIGGAMQASADERFPSTNPATGEPLAEITVTTKAGIDAAIAAARAAQPDWENGGGPARARVLYALARMVQRHARLFAVLETLDGGKPIRESRDIDIPLVARHFYYHAGMAQLIGSEMPDRRAHGVCAQVIPWNFPLLMLSWKVAPALAAGNTVVLKPAEQTSLTALLFAELAHKAGLPPGVLNLVTGAGDVGAALVAHPDVDKVAFTGSTEVGRAIRTATAGQGKALTLELGGKSPYIVCADADLDSAVEGLVDAIWFNQGEVCCAGSRLIVQECIAEDFSARLRARMARLRVGDPLDKCTDIGAMVSPEQRDRVRAMVAQVAPDAVHSPDIDLPEAGCFLPPMLIDGLDAAHPLMQEEIFGPVLVSTTFRTPAEAAALANNTRYGLAATVWSENLNLALDIARQVRAGVVWVNATNLFDAAAGFGGVRESGFGREGGWEGMTAYTRAREIPSASQPAEATAAVPAPTAAIDRTAKLYIGGKQARPDGGYSTPVVGADGTSLGDAGVGNRKDIRNAVEAARKAQPGWVDATAHLRAQILYFIAENLSARAAEFTARLTAMSGDAETAAAEVEAACDALFTFAAWADKRDGAVKPVPLRGLALALREPVGVIGVLCPEAAPLLGPVTALAAAAAMGNTCVLVPSERHPLAATDLYQVLDTSDLPGGVVNIVTGSAETLGPVLAEHMDVDALWSFGDDGLAAELETRSAGSLKRCWVAAPDAVMQGAGTAPAQHALLDAATEIKTVWVPYGEGA